MHLRILFKGILKKYDFRELGIIGEPDLDIYFKDVFYLTDTGGDAGMDIKLVSGIGLAISNKKWEEQKLVFHSQRWLDKPLPWLKELFFQNTKNVIKRLICCAGGEG